MGCCYRGELYVLKKHYDLTEVEALLGLEFNDMDSVDMGNIIQCANNEAKDGKFETIEDALVRMRIPFDRFSEGYLENEKEMRHFRPSLNGSKDTDMTIYDEGKIYPGDVKKLSELSAKEFKKAVLELVNKNDPYVVPLEEL